MSRFRVRVRLLPLVAAVFVISGLALMIASLRISTTASTTSAVDSASAVIVPTVASAALVSTTPAASDPRATKLFARAQHVSRTLTYSGVKLVSRWEQGTTTSVVVSLVHVPGRGTYTMPGDVEGSDATPTPAAESYATESGAGDDSAMLTALVRNYRLDAIGPSMVVGRSAQIVEADRADGTVAARFWIDDDTGLVLRRELIDPTGRPVETAGFVRVSFAAPSTDALPAPSTTAWSAVDPAGVAALRSAGWPLPQTLAGGLGLYEVHEQQAPGTVVQLSYTDGLFAVSVFVQRGVLDDSALTGYVSRAVDGGQVWVRESGTPFVVWQSRTPGATTTAAASDDIVVSATSDSPLAPLGSVLAALPAEPAPADGVGQRVARGVARVSSWFDPSQ